MSKELLYVDMDGVLADYDKREEKLEEERGGLDDKAHVVDKHFFRHLDPIDGSLEAYKRLHESYDTRILTMPSWRNPKGWMDKRLWVEEHLGEVAKDRLIFAADKHLLRGDILIDDYIHHAQGFDRFIHFGSHKYPDWGSVLDVLL